MQIQDQRNFYFRVISNGLFNLRLKTEERKNKIRMLEKVHGKEYKAMKGELRKKQEAIDKLKRKGNSYDKEEQVDQRKREMYLKSKLFKDQEKQAIRRACMEERGIYIDLSSFLKQLLLKEALLINESSSVQNDIKEIRTFIENPHDIPNVVMNDILENNNDDLMDFHTPSTSVNGSLRGSRCNSISSLNNSRPSSPLCIRESEREQADTQHLHKRGGSLRCSKKNRSVLTYYGNVPLNEGISSIFSPKFSNQVRLTDNLY